MVGAGPVSDGAVHSSVRLWLRLEGLMALLAATYLHAHQGGSWLAFAVLFFVPDVSFAGYTAGPRVGAALYNVAHSYVGPLMIRTSGESEKLRPRTSKRQSSDEGSHQDACSSQLPTLQNETSRSK